MFASFFQVSFGQEASGPTQAPLLQDIVEQILVCIPCQEPGQFASQPIAKALRELRIIDVFQAVQDECAKKHLTARVIGAFLLR